ncbi:RdgB/HAM1 family non-canonical purine NTP pyrophosphatase [Cohnella sp. REN36]|uniref:RdgB/HAM1 family non-canonical purine NTP pyrophosphatase n=1 Tax=Cohnella sp. REN36 TaxID=2887347 RepID=UPI001D15BCCA|nr:RdgB/HAM1 family non-canonical purine NTP pyrophosphatase [Cohnella sp. REN36]MCC3375719.1 RdgB/HAM1 family non-canonical purine NTP pyrophosphatase [Cohnella sp. REN36]
MIRAGETLLVATRNRGKTNEFRAAFAPLGIEVRDLNEAPEAIPDIVEDGETFADNALIKARIVSEATGLPTLADDSGLCVDALGGAPGVYSARYAGAGASDADNNAKLLRELAATGLTPPDEAAAAGAPDALSAARFVSALVLYAPGGETKTAEGDVRGFILPTPRGEGGFGYDPLFWLPNYGRTMAELSTEEKNAVSHRGEALRRLLARL